MRFCYKIMKQFKFTDPIIISSKLDLKSVTNGVYFVLAKISDTSISTKSYINILILRNSNMTNSVTTNIVSTCYLIFTSSQRLWFHLGGCSRM